MSDRARAAMAYVAARSTGPPLDRDLRITLNFHPDRAIGAGSVLAGLARSGRYVSQFVTGTGSGSLSAYPGGDRWTWEHEAFGGAYDDAPADERPCYGGLDRARRPGGAAPRFGSAYLRLREHALDRATFCFPDSVFRPEHVGTSKSCDLVDRARTFSSVPRTDADEATTGGRLDDYVEAQVHGGVVLVDDVEALVLDPCFHGTDVERDAATLGVPVEWHSGFRLTTDELVRHPDFRGPDVVAAGLRVARDGVLDARVVGEAVVDGRESPDVLKRVWHHVARFGAPVRS